MTLPFREKRVKCVTKNGVQIEIFTHRLIYYISNRNAKLGETKIVFKFQMLEESSCKSMKCNIRFFRN